MSLGDLSVDVHEQLVQGGRLVEDAQVCDLQQSCLLVVHSCCLILTRFFLLINSSLMFQLFLNLILHRSQHSAHIAKIVNFLRLLLLCLRLFSIVYFHAPDNGLTTSSLLLLLQCCHNLLVLLRCFGACCLDQFACDELFLFLEAFALPPRQNSLGQVLAGALDMLIRK